MAATTEQQNEYDNLNATYADWYASAKGNVASSVLNTLDDQQVSVDNKWTYGQYDAALVDLRNLVQSLGGYYSVPVDPMLFNTGPKYYYGADPGKLIVLSLFALGALFLVIKAAK